MKQRNEHRARRDDGFSLIEVLVALLVTMIVMAAVFGLLQKGQDSFRREPEVADLQMSARAGLDMVSRDLTVAGFETPPVSAILWADGGGITPDELTIVYNDSTIPQSKPLTCAGNPGPCKTIDKSSTVFVDPDSFDPPVANPEEAYEDGMVLFAIETGDCNNNGKIDVIPFEVTQPPNMSGGKLNVNHNPGNGNSDVNRPEGFDRQVHPDCALIGRFRVIQYRINPLPPAQNPNLERRDLGMGEDWTPVSRNIENLQVQYAVGSDQNFVDTPAQPAFDDPATWITRVRVTVAGRSESRNLQGGTEGVFAAEDTHLRKTFSTTVSLRNQMAAAAQTGNDAYN